jgi:hypothetical protein
VAVGVDMIVREQSHHQTSTVFLTRNHDVKNPSARRLKQRSDSGMSYQLGRSSLVAARRIGRIFSIRFNSTSTILPPLIGTAPQYTRHLILYTQHTVETWPSHIESVSPLLTALSALKMTKLGITMAEDPKSIGTSWNLDTTLAVNPATPSTIEEE